MFWLVGHQADGSIKPKIMLTFQQSKNWFCYAKGIQIISVNGQILRNHGVILTSSHGGMEDADAEQQCRGISVIRKKYCSVPGQKQWHKNNSTATVVFSCFTGFFLEQFWVKYITSFTLKQCWIFLADQSGVPKKVLLSSPKNHQTSALLNKFLVSVLLNARLWMYGGLLSIRQGNTKNWNFQKLWGLHFHSH